VPTSRESLITVLYGSSATTAPSDLYDGELAFANGSGSNKKLFVGSNSNNTANWVGAIIEDQATIDWSSVSSENNKLATQYAVKSLAGNYLPLSGGSLTGDLSLGTTSEIVFTARGGGGGTLTLQAPTATTSNAAYTFTLPANDGNASEVLTTDGSGVLSWGGVDTATNVSVTNDDATTTAYIAFTNATSGATALRVDSDGLTYNAASDSLSVGGDISVGGVIRTSAASFNFVTATATTLNIGLVATAVSIGAATGTTTINNADTVVTGDLAVNGGDITTTAAGTATVFNTNATTLNVGGAATTVTIGAGAGTTTTIRGGTLVGGTQTQNVFNTLASTVNAFGAAATANIGYNGTAASTTNISTGAAASLTTKTLNLGTGGAEFSTTNVNIGSVEGGTTTVNSPFLVGACPIQAVFNTTATTVNAFGAATAITMGATSGTTTTIRGGTLVGNTTTQNLFNTTATTLNLGGAATAITMGDSTTATTTIRGGTLVGNTTTQNVFDSTATTVNAFGAATTASFGYDGASGATTGIANGATGSGSTNTINIGAIGESGSTTNVNIGSSAGGTVALGYNATVGNNLTVTGDLTVNGTTVTVNTSTLSVEDPLIKLANGNSTADSVDIGFYGLYDTSGSQDLYCGLIRDASDGKFRLFVDSQSEPTTTVNTGATGYSVGTLVANIRGGTFT